MPRDLGCGVKADERDVSPKRSHLKSPSRWLIDRRRQELPSAAGLQSAPCLCDASGSAMHLWAHDRWLFPLPEHHRYPLSKGRLLRERLIRLGTCAVGDFLEAEPARWSALARVHDPAPCSAGSAAGNSASESSAASGCHGQRRSSSGRVG